MKYREDLPQLNGELFITDGGIETTLIFHEGLELPDFAAFHLLQGRDGTMSLEKYFRTYAEIAKRFSSGLVLESATWRANPDWGSKLGYTAESLAAANRLAIELLERIRDDYEDEHTAVVISGCLGPRGDGYVPGQLMSADQAHDYHLAQIEVFAHTAADMVSAITINYVNEALGIARAAQLMHIPVAISFTVETDGHLPTGQSLRSAINEVDEATDAYPSYYMINCAHPTHFEHALDDSGAWIDRIQGLRANASRKSHSELNDSVELDIGDPAELGAEYASLIRRMPRLNVMGGCCGTDHRHVQSIAAACAPLFR